MVGGDGAFAEVDREIDDVWVIGSKIGDWWWRFGGVFIRRFGGTDVLSLLGHVAFDGGFGFGQEVGDELRCEAWPRCEEALFDGGDPSVLDRAASCGVEKLGQCDFVALVVC